MKHTKLFDTKLTLTLIGGIAAVLLMTTGCETYHAYPEEDPRIIIVESEQDQVENTELDEDTHVEFFGETEVEPNEELAELDDASTTSPDESPEAAVPTVDDEATTDDVETDTPVFAVAEVVNPPLYAVDLSNDDDAETDTPLIMAKVVNPPVYAVDLPNQETVTLTAETATGGTWLEGHTCDDDEIGTSLKFIVSNRPQLAVPNFSEALDLGCLSGSQIRSGRPRYSDGRNDWNTFNPSNSWNDIITKESQFSRSPLSIISGLKLRQCDDNSRGLSPYRYCKISALKRFIAEDGTVTSEPEEEVLFAQGNSGDTHEPVEIVCPVSHPVVTAIQHKVERNSGDLSGVKITCSKVSVQTVTETREHTHTEIVTR